MKLRLPSWIRSLALRFRIFRLRRRYGTNPKPVDAENGSFQDPAIRSARLALDSLERALAKRGHKSLGLPTPPKDKRKRREWLIRMAQHQGKTRR